MKISPTSIAEVLVIEPGRARDSRGTFMELFRCDRYSVNDVAETFVQDNWSRSNRGVLRGLHLQHPKAQAKLITVITGEIFDVAVDCRVGSPTFGSHVSVILSEDNGRQMLIPKGFAHGFQVLSDRADVVYKCDNYYSPGDEMVVRWDDPEIGIDWPIMDPVLSPRDSAAPSLSEIDRLPHWQKCTGARSE